jgi:hypothetical protein
MGIAYNLVEISIDFEILGFYNKRWEPFQEGSNYEAFLIKKK